MILQELFSRIRYESAIAGKNGILKLTLHSNAYEWEFMTVDGESPDKGSQSCR